MTAIGAVLLGLLIGLSLGALGGGGSILTVPALVYVLGETAHQATTSSLVIVGITAAAAAAGHARAGRVRWRAGTVFGAVGVGASFLGSYLNRMVDPNLLLLAFAALMIIAAVALLRQVGSPVAAPVRELVTVGAAQNDVGAVQDGVPPHTSRRSVVTKVVVAGLIVGFLTGFLGVGGGFVIVPALTVGLRYTMPNAVGTSLLVIALNSAAALLARVGHEGFHWAVIVPFTVAAIAGSVAGKRIADRVAPASLTRAFGYFMIAIAGYVAIRSGVGL
jgi:uncharacterized membrane protein YfcA